MNENQFQERDLAVFDEFSRMLKDKKIYALYSRTYSHAIVRELIRAEIEREEVGFTTIYEGFKHGKASRKSVYDFITHLVELEVLIKTDSVKKKTLKVLRLSEDVRLILLEFLRVI